jgi:hypothetical protein
MSLLEMSGSHEVSRPASSATPGDIDTYRQIRAEAAMVRASIVGFLVSVPIAIAVLVGMMWLAMGDTEPWYVWVGFGAGMGVYAAGFLGTTAGVLLSARRLNRIAGGNLL